MTYKGMITDARAKGLGTEKTMWACIDDVSNMLDLMKEEHPDMYWQNLRRIHKTLYGAHYDKEFAEYDVSRLEYTMADGRKSRGEHWSEKETTEATRTKVFPQDTTKWDVYVAYNVMYADLCRSFSDQQILTAAYLFFFDDEDAKEGKIWHYMSHV